MPKRPYPRYQRRHDAILLAILENPLQTNKEIAKATGYSPSQVSRITCSPAFRQLHDAAFIGVVHGARTQWAGPETAEEVAGVEGDVPPRPPPDAS